MEYTDLYLEDYDWSVRVYFNVSSEDATDVVDFLDDMDYNTPLVKKVEKSLLLSDIDLGITVLNKEQRHTTIIVTKASSSGEFFNTLIHELKHLVDFIGVVECVSLTGEELAYMIGDIGSMVFPMASKYICN